VDLTRGPVDRQATRGNGFRLPEVEVMGSGSGTHDLRLAASEPIASPEPGAHPTTEPPGHEGT